MSRILRISATVAALFLFFPDVAHPVSIREAYPQYLKTTDFQRLMEFFSGREHPGNRVILRTDESARDGLYFIIHLDDFASELPEGCTIDIDLVTSRDRQPQVFSFEVEPTTRRTRRILAGVTGVPWIVERPAVLAWRVALRSRDGRPLAAKNSFLWEMP